MTAIIETIYITSAPFSYHSGHRTVDDNLRFKHGLSKAISNYAVAALFKDFQLGDHHCYLVNVLLYSPI